MLCVKSREVIAKIESLGGEFVRQTGSHQRYSATFAVVDDEGQPVIDGNGKPKTSTAFTTVPVHSGKDIPTGTLRSIQRQMEAAFGKGWLL